MMPFNQVHMSSCAEGQVTDGKREYDHRYADAFDIHWLIRYDI